MSIILKGKIMNNAAKIALTCMVLLTGCAANNFPAVSDSSVLDALVGADCSSGENRSKSIARDPNGLQAHPVQLCQGEDRIGTAIFWSGTNAAGTQLISKPTDLTGKEYAVLDGGMDSSTGSNSIEFVVDEMVCIITKPRGGISPSTVAECRADTVGQITEETFAGKAVIYEDGIRQTWSANGSSSYGGRTLAWRIHDGKYCSRNPRRDEICWDVRVINNGTQLVFEPNSVDPNRYVGTFVQ